MVAKMKNLVLKWLFSKKIQFFSGFLGKFPPKNYNLLQVRVDFVLVTVSTDLTRSSRVLHKFVASLNFLISFRFTIVFIRVKLTERANTCTWINRWLKQNIRRQTMIALHALFAYNSFSHSLSFP